MRREELEKKRVGNVRNRVTQIDKDRAEQIGSGSVRKRSDMNEKQKEIEWEPEQKRGQKLKRKKQI